ncbi:MAG: acyl carrier protein [Burkholderiales bacterium]|nr:acyl carrier protein [Burkholderiales bacterium]MDE1928031.1 acyl carrier protein [Burkholderiales bacterium]MDE2159395.1 acyl carrier protein [Burkholderiales bacterium]MDE2502299.1 acyl carrier protein [Burkholderiales bacterium]
MRKFTFDAVADLLVREFDVAPDMLQPQTRLVDLGLDSLTLVEFIFAAEDRFAFTVPWDRLDRRNDEVTLGTLCAAIDAEAPTTA